jgi:6-phosphofructokinase 2
MNDEQELEEEARSLVNKGQSEVVIISLGGVGALGVWKGGCARIQSPAVPIKSRVGAGDSAVAGIVLALSRGQLMRDSLLFGVAAGAAAVMTPGTELCRREDVERLYKQMVSSKED